MNAVLLSERPMAKKKTAGRPPKPGGEGRPVRIAPDLAMMARAVATRRGQTLGDYLGGLLRQTVTRDYLSLVREDHAKGGAK